MTHSFLPLLLLPAALLFPSCAETRTAAPANAPAVPIFWHEAEDFTSAPQAMGDPVRVKLPASGGRVLNGSAYRHKGDAVTYQFNLPYAIPHAQILIRYARLHWKGSMVPAQFAIELTPSSGPALKAEVAFPDTKGWGDKPADFRLAAAPLGSLPAGPATLKLTGLTNDNDVTLDGFFLAPAELPLTADELALNRIAITSEGYVGLAISSTIRQDVNRSFTVVMRDFAQPLSAGSKRAPTMVVAPPVSANMPSLASATYLTPVVTALGLNGLTTFRYELPSLSDATYQLYLSNKSPHADFEMPVVFAGQFLAALPPKLAALEAFTTQLAASKKPADAAVLPDFQHAVAYLKTTSQKLSDSAPAGDALKQGLAAKEGLSDPAPAIDNLYRTLAQYEESMARVQAGQDPYAGRTGDFRCAFRSAITGDLHVFRVFVPSNYNQAAKVPFILMLHGGGGDENSFPDLDNGQLLRTINDRGYLIACPAYQSRTPNNLADLQQLLALLAARYPKIDPARRYCTGLSMGGFTTYALATARPDLFAAICCVSGTGNVALADKLQSVPTLIIQGGIDDVVPPAGAQRITARLKELGATVDLQIFPTHGHDYYVDPYLRISLDFFDRHRKE